MVSHSGKVQKWSKKWFPTAGKYENAQRNGFPQRESTKMFKEIVSHSGKVQKWSWKWFPTAGKYKWIQRGALCIY